MLKEEPDDTANLPSSYNRSNPLTEPCLPPLDETTPLFGEIFDELILPDGYATLLTDDVNSIDSHSTKMNIDPFMSYRDESSDTVGTPILLSPENITKVRGSRTGRKDVKKVLKNEFTRKKIQFK